MGKNNFNGVEEVFWEYYDTAGNYQWNGTMTGHHVIKLNEQDAREPHYTTLRY